MEGFNPRKFYNDLAEKYPEEVIVYATNMGKAHNTFVKRHLDKMKGSLLDVGCHSGRYSLYYNNGYVVGVDIARALIRKAAKRNKKLKDTPFEKDFLVRDICAIPFPSPVAFENCLCVETLEHIPTPELALNNIRKLLVKNGLLFLTVPRFFGDMSKRNDWILPPLVKQCGLDTRYYHRRYGVEEIKALIRKCGFEIVQSGGYLEDFGWGGIYIFARRIK